MPRLTVKDKNPYTLKNYFGFDEQDIDFSLWNNSTRANDTHGPVEFQQNKPYRLALYVRPSEHKRLQKTNASILVKSTLEKLEKNKKNDTTVNKSTISNNTESKTRKKGKKIANVMLFDENTKPENVSKRFKKTPEKPKSEKSVTIVEPLPSLRKNILKEVNTKPVTKTKQNKTRRSYERKCKEKETEIVIEPPSEEIIKEIEIKKLSRTKQKKTAKEDKEFENWANTMNSAFNDVDKFELSITYD